MIQIQLKKKNNNTQTIKKKHLKMNHPNHLMKKQVSINLTKKKVSTNLPRNKTNLYLKIRKVQVEVIMDQMEGEKFHHQLD